MKINKFLKSKSGVFILSVVLGLGLACIFRQACNGRNCIVYKAPKPSDVKNSIYSHDEKCYKYESVTTDCTENAI